MKKKKSENHADEIEIDPFVMNYLERNPGNYRLMTSCGGAILVPLVSAERKDSDIPVKAGKSMIYFSRHQYDWGYKKIERRALNGIRCF